jgi:hypothetical protein
MDKPLLDVEHLSPLGLLLSIAVTFLLAGIAGWYAGSLWLWLRRL